MSVVRFGIIAGEHDNMSRIEMTSSSLLAAFDRPAAIYFPEDPTPAQWVAVRHSYRHAPGVPLFMIDSGLLVRHQHLMPLIEEAIIQDRVTSFYVTNRRSRPVDIRKAPIQLLRDRERDQSRALFLPARVVESLAHYRSMPTIWKQLNHWEEPIHGAFPNPVYKLPFRL